MATVRYDEATRIFPKAERAAVDGLTLEIPDGEFLVLVGPSGCGKSTSLRMLAGLEDVDSGSVWIGDRDVTGLPPKLRDVAMVFQNYALYPHMTVAENIGFALKLAHVPKAEIRNRVADAAKMLDLEEYLARKPKAALGRAAPAGGDGTGDRAAAAGVPARRAALEPRREVEGSDADPDRLAAAPARGDDRLRHARPGRGDDDGRPGRRARPTASCSKWTRRARSSPTRPTCSSPASSGRPR